MISNLYFPHTFSFVRKPRAFQNNDYVMSRNFFIFIFLNNS